MSKKTYQLVVAIVTGVQTISIGLVTYLSKDVAVAAAVNASITIACTAALQICSKFVKEEK